MTENRKIAVALRYPADADAPFISASGRGELAEKLLEIAAENDIPVVKNDEVASILSMQEIGTGIPAETWQIIAEIFAFIIKQETVT
jgi:flagellar biosynthesis protein